MLNAGIYQIRNIVNNKCYVGSSKDINSRLNQHKRNLKQEKHCNIALQRAWDKYGEDCFRFEALAYLELEDIRVTEQRLIDYHKSRKNTSYNISTSAIAPMMGRKHKKESIEKMSASRTGNKSRTGYPSHWKGKKLSPEMCEAISKGKTNPSLETREKMSKAKIGHIPSNKGEKKEFCKRGHALTLDNVCGASRTCRICKRMRDKIYKENKRNKG